MLSSKYHREQAQVLAGLALSTNDAAEADRFTQAAIGHLERAKALDSAAPYKTGANSDKYADRD